MNVVLRWMLRLLGVPKLLSVHYFFFKWTCNERGRLDCLDTGLTGYRQITTQRRQLLGCPVKTIYVSRHGPRILYLQSLLRFADVKTLFLPQLASHTSCTRSTSEALTLLLVLQLTSGVSDLRFWFRLVVRVPAIAAIRRDGEAEWT